MTSCERAPEGAEVVAKFTHPDKGHEIHPRYFPSSAIERVLDVSIEEGTKGLTDLLRCRLLYEEEKELAMRPTTSLAQSIPWTLCANANTHTHTLSIGSK